MKPERIRYLASCVPMVFGDGAKAMGGKGMLVFRLLLWTLVFQDGLGPQRSHGQPQPWVWTISAVSSVLPSEVSSLTAFIRTQISEGSVLTGAAKFTHLRDKNSERA